MKIIDWEAWKRVAWGHPDSPIREICALCAGPLPEVPLMLWKDDGSAASLCDGCVSKLIGVKAQ